MAVNHCSLETIIKIIVLTVAAISVIVTASGAGDLAAISGVINLTKPIA